MSGSMCDAGLGVFYAKTSGWGATFDVARLIGGSLFFERKTLRRIAMYQGPLGFSIGIAGAYLLYAVVLRFDVLGS